MKEKKSRKNDYSKEIVPPKSKMKAYGGKKDKETRVQDEEDHIAVRSPRTFSKKEIVELRNMKKEYKG
jgi:hypothetical protein